MKKWKYLIAILIAVLLVCPISVVAALEEPENYKLYVNAPENGKIEILKKEKIGNEYIISADEVVKVAVTPDTGYQISDVKVTEIESQKEVTYDGKEQIYTFKIQKDSEVFAEFTKKEEDSQDNRSEESDKKKDNRSEESDKKKDNSTKVKETLKPAVLSAVKKAASKARQTVDFNGYAEVAGVRCGKFTVDGKTAFCMEHKKVTPITGNYLTESIYKNETIRKVLYYGYKGTEQWSGFKSKEQGIVCTSLALSYFYSGKDTIGFKLGSSKDKSIKLSKFLDYIEDKEAPSETFNLSKKSVKSYASGTIQRTPNIKFNADTRNSVTMKLPSGIKLVKVSGKTSGTTGSVKIYGDTTFYLTAPLDKKGTFKTGKLKGTRKEFQAILLKTGNSQVQDLVKTVVQDPTATVSLNVTWDADPGTFLINKRLRLSNGLQIKAGAGVEFTCTHNETKQKIVLKTDANGVAKSKVGSMPAGRWTVVETKTPVGYKKAGNFSVSIASSEVAKTVVNEPISSFKILKKDAKTGAVLPGATFKIRNKDTQKDITWKRNDGTSFTTFQTGADGTATLPYATTVASSDPKINVLKPGNYVLIETKAPPGYHTMKDLPFTINSGWNGTTPITLTATNDYTKIIVTKTDPSGKEIVGANLQVTDSSGKVIDSWTSDGKPHVIQKLIVGQTYTLSEVTAPDQYVRANSVKFTVQDVPEQTVQMIDKQVSISKKDITNQKEIPGAKLRITDSSGEVIDSWTSTEEPHYVSGLIAGGTYTLSEIEAPPGYAIAKDVKFTVLDNGKVQSETMYDNPIEIVKVDGVTKKNLPGAELVVLDKKEKEIDRWITMEEPHKVKGLHVGETYILREIKAPDGYAIVDDMEFTVEKDTEKIQVVSLADKPIEIVKVDGVTKKNLAGAKLAVLKKEKSEEGQQEEPEIRNAAENPEDGESENGETLEEIPGVSSDETVLDYWTTTEEPHKVKGLRVGETYILREISAPDGYAVADDMKFTVEKDTETVQKVSIENKPIEIVKVDSETKKNLPGAELVVLKKEETTGDSEVEQQEKPESRNTVEVPENEESGNGEVTEEPEDGESVEGESTEEPVEIPGLSSGEILLDHWVTTEEPHKVKGLHVGETYILREISAPDGYAVATDMEFTVEKDTKIIQKISMTDKQIYVSKQDVTTQKELPGAELVLTDKDGKELDRWTSTEEPHLLKGLKVGETYTLTETLAPDSYVVANSIDFVVEDDGKLQTVIMYDKIVEVIKKDKTTKKELEGAVLAVYDKNGRELDKWTSTKEPHKVKGLHVGETYILRELSAPAGYVIAKDIEFVVTDENSVQTVIMEDERNQVEVEKLAIDTRRPLAGCELHLIAGEDIYTPVDIQGKKTLLYKKGEIVEKIKTGDKNWKKDKFPAGQYILREISCPPEYLLAPDMKFTITADTSEVQKITMVDQMHIGGLVTSMPPDKPRELVKTGDTSKIALMLSAMAGASICIGVILHRKKKRAQEEEEEDDESESTT